MALVTIPQWLFYFILAYTILLFGVIIFLIFQKFKFFWSDKVILLDKDRRWKMYPASTFGVDKIEIDKKGYFPTKETGFVNNWGKSLHIFTEGKPNPLKIANNESEWVNSKNMIGILNNDIINKIVTPKNKLSDLILMIICFASVLAAMAGIVCVLILLGVIKVKTLVPMAA